MACSLITVDDYKDLAGISRADVSRDTQIKALVNAVSDQLARLIHRNIAKTEYTEYLSGDGDSILKLSNYPIISVSRVCIDNAGYFGQAENSFPVSSDLIQGVDYAIMAGVNGIGSSGFLRKIGGNWYRPRGYAIGKVAVQHGAPTGNILVEYMAGYSPIPGAIKFAVSGLVSRAMSSIASGLPASSESYEDASASYFSPTDMAMLAGTVERTLGSMKSVVV